MRGWNSDNFSDNYVVRASCLSSLNLDIVGVVETHLKNDETLEVAGYEWFGQNRKHLHVNARCGSGGVGILIKNALLREFECKVVDNSYEGTLWLRLKHKFNRTCLILCVCYLPPENSSRQADVFGFYDNLLTGIYEFQDMGPVCLFGDFNSRCADLNDYIKGVDNLSDGEVVDFQVNKYGHILLDFLINSNFCILNGRNSIKNDFTSVSTKGSSVVDYCFVSHSDLNMFSDFYVYTASELINLSGHKEAVIPSSIPDHSCITWKTNTEQYTSYNTVPNYKQSEGSIKFNVIRIPDDFGCNSVFVNEIHACVLQLERSLREQQDIDNAYANICKLIKGEMFDKLPHKTVLMNGGESNKRRRSAKPWWNDDLSYLWNETCLAEKHWLNHKMSSGKRELRAIFISKRKLFNKNVQKAKRRYWYELQTDLVKQSNEDPQSFWKTIGKVGVAFDKRKKIPMQIVGENGEIITDKNVVLNKWKNSFSDLFSQQDDTMLAWKMAILLKQHVCQNLMMKFPFQMYIRQFSMQNVKKHLE